jgi:predicted ATPase
MQSSSGQESVCFGPFRLFPVERRLERDGNPVSLSARAFDILVALVERAGAVVRKNELLARAWPEAQLDEGNLRVQMAALRKALGDGEAGARYVATISGQGYCFVARVSRPDDPQGPAADQVPPQQDLPPPPTRMVGRDQTVDDISEKLGHERFITIVGPGGIGKTTVAISVGHNLLMQFAGAVHFFDLGTVQDSTLVANIIATTLGSSSRSNDPTDSLIALVRDQRMLLILDCCEHLIETTAALAERLYTEAPQVHILATSRETLRVEGEHIYRLSPLTYPPDQAVFTAAQALDFPAVRLFVERAIASNDEFELRERDAAFACELCRRLDGIPLAIELAASRASVHGIKDTIALLNDQFKLVGQGRRTALPRHQTLRATFDWSYKLLTTPERALLCRLSIFAGPFTLDGARAVAVADDTGASEVLDLLGSLVAKSIVTTLTSDRSLRYRLLDTTRTYALEKLAVELDADATARSHALYFLHVLERAEASQLSELSSPVSLAAQFGNVRAALRWCFSESGDRVTGVALAAASMPLFFELSQLTECQLWATRAIESLDQVDLSARHELKLHAALGSAEMLVHGATEAAGSSLTKALRLAEELDDLPDQLRLIEQLHLFHFRSGHLTKALELAQTGEAIASRDGNPDRLARIQLALGISYHIAGNGPLARRYIENALLHVPGPKRVAVDQLHVDHVGRARMTLARLLWLEGCPEQADRLARQAITEAASSEHPVRFSMAVIWAFSVFFWNSELDWFEEYVDRLLLETRKHAMGPHRTIGQAAKGTILIRKGQVETGLAMLREAQQLRRSHHYELPTDYSISLAMCLARREQDDEALSTIDQAIAEAERRQNLINSTELLRVKADILMSAKQPDLIAAESLLSDALDRARRQFALGWELRVATSLARLRMALGRHHEARDVLAPVYGRFREGFDRPDLKQASELLNRLSSHSVCALGVVGTLRGVAVNCSTAPPSSRR